MRDRSTARPRDGPHVEGAEQDERASNRPAFFVSYLRADLLPCPELLKAVFTCVESALFVVVPRFLTVSRIHLT